MERPEIYRFLRQLRMQETTDLADRSLVGNGRTQTVGYVKQTVCTRQAMEALVLIPRLVDDYGVAGNVLTQLSTLESQRTVRCAVAVLVPWNVVVDQLVGVVSGYASAVVR